MKRAGRRVQAKWIRVGWDPGWDLGTTGAWTCPPSRVPAAPVLPPPAGPVPPPPRDPSTPVVGTLTPMYSHCPTCIAPLGRNRVLEPFPVGERIAFDLKRGRLWVLCPRCRSWNLAPLEERWEAVEAAERLFETAVVGASTREMALGRVADGTELIRVGGAREVELAGWRYGREMVSRWRRHRNLGMVGGGLGLGLVLLPAAGSGLVASLGVGAGALTLLLRRLRSNRPVFRRPATSSDASDDELPGILIQEGGADQSPIRLFRQRDVERLLLVPGPDQAGGWQLMVDRWYRPPMELERQEAERALRAMLAAWNPWGGSPSQVERALTRVRELGSADRVLARAARDLNEGHRWEHHMAWPFRDAARIQWADPTLRLALEVAANEEMERRALEGELRLLEREWTEAEELAAIADTLTVNLLGRKMREGRSGSGGSP